MAAALAQYTVSGQVIDDEGRPLLGANIVAVGGSEGATTDADGRFALTIEDDEPCTIEIRFIAHRTLILTVGPDRTDVGTRTLVFNPLSLSEIVVTASRVEEAVVNAPSSIQVLDRDEVLNSSGADFYSELDHLKDVQVIDNSFGFKIFNARGFNSTSAFRIVQFLDGMDNMSVGLNFAPGNLFGSSDLDIEQVEVLSGPASALYGPNALQGVVSIETKNPLHTQGVAAQIKAGNRAFLQGDLWVGDYLDRKERIAFKISASYFQANDWVADDPVANAYRPVATPPVNLAGLAQSRAATDPLYSDFIDYLGANPSVNPNDIPPGTQFTLPGYMESDIQNNETHSAKLSAGLFYRIKKTENSYLFKYANASGTYQGNNRAVFRGFDFYQNRLQIENDRFLLRYYNNIDESGDSYDLVLAGINLGFAGLGGYSQQYLSSYVSAIRDLSNGFTAAADPSMRGMAVETALADAEEAWLDPGTPQFNGALDAIRSNPDRPQGAGYIDKSTLHHVDAVYDQTFGILELVAGASFRRFNPKSDGTLFVDTLQANGEFNDVSFNEYGLFSQLSASFLNDRLKLIGSVRFDKSQNFNAQISPRGGVLMDLGDHNLRLVAQSAFRTPTLNDQFFFLNVGPLIVRGNIDGFENVYTQSSVLAYEASGPPGGRDASLLEVINIPAVQPERLNSVEFGYRGTLFSDRLLIDANAYFNQYQNFIANKRAVQTRSSEGGTAEAQVDLDTRNYQVFAIASNAEENVRSLGFAVSTGYDLGGGFVASANYTYNNFLDEDIDDDLIPGFNTPAHKVNLGISGRQVWKGLGFSANWKWVDFYDWEAPFASGRVPAFNTLDLEVRYEIETIGTTVKFGSTNLYDNDHIEAFGAGRIGGFYYASIIFQSFRNETR